MKPEQLYYENPDLWIADKYKDLEAVRANITKQWLPKTVKSVLDIGCGNGVVTDILEQFAVGVDRSIAALHHLQAPHCQADALELPFANGAFDAAIATEVIEHLPFHSYKTALEEMVRIIRHYILITVPYQEDLISSQIMCPACKCRFNPNFHARAFTLYDIQNLFKDFPAIQIVQASGIIAKSRYRSDSLRKGILGYLTRQGPSYLNNFKNKICPLCGYFEKDEPNKGPFMKKSGLLEKVINHSWPRQNVYRWWIALYSKS